jgi:predicted metal-binding membrane protein
VYLTIACRTFAFMNPKSSVEVLIQRDRLWVALGLVTAIGLAWTYLLRESAAMTAVAAEAQVHAAMGMTAMTMRTWGVSDWFALFAMWTVMMVGMMLPSAAPVILLVLGAYRLRREASARAAAFAFVCGYLLVWTAFSAVAALGQFALHRAAVLSMEMRLYSATVSGVILLIAGAYQWLPLKNRCLVHCQTPLAFLTQHWRRRFSSFLTSDRVRRLSRCLRLLCRRRRIAQLTPQDLADIGLRQLVAKLHVLRFLVRR